MNNQQKLFCQEYVKNGNNGTKSYMIAYPRSSEKSAKDNNIQQVRFIAEVDERTTKMCKNMNGMIFNVQAENRFRRYFGTDSKHLCYKVITCYGLVKGLNMPPIDNHFHWCRSTLTYQLDMTKEELEADKEENEKGYMARHTSSLGQSNDTGASKTIRKFVEKIEINQIDNKI